MNRQIQLNSLINTLTNDSVKYKRLISKPEEERTESEIEEIASISDKFLNLANSPATAAMVPSRLAMQAFEILKIDDGWSKAFEHTPIDSSVEYPTDVVDSTLSTSSLIVNHPYVANGFAQSRKKRTLGMVDDVFTYTGENTIRIEKQDTRPNQLTSSLHDGLDIQSGYLVNFEFRLKRFPQKVYHDTDKEYYPKRLISRSTDLIKFNYGQDQYKPFTIEFGAMAPFDQSINEETNRRNNMFTRRLSPFSIAACITKNNGDKVSVYTDYKFELGKAYSVSLEIINDDFQNGGEFTIRMYVNSVLENIATHKGKVWSKHSNRYRLGLSERVDIENLTIASKPGFMKATGPNHITDKKVQEQAVENREELSLNLLDIQYTRRLYEISAPPYYTKLKDKPGHRYIKLYNTGLRGINNGVEIGKTSIYYK